MQTKLLFFACVFLVIIILLALKRPLWQAILGGIVLIVILNQIPPMEVLNCITHVLTNRNSLFLIVSLYFITYLQEMLNLRNLPSLVVEDLNHLFRSKRANIISTAIFFGLLPSPAATIFCGDIVKESTGEYLDKYEQAFVTSWYRHIPESFMPTYSFILLFATLANVPITQFIACMIVPVILFILVGYYPYITKLPKASSDLVPSEKGKYLLQLLTHLWPILLVLVLILAGGFSVIVAILISIVATGIVYRFKGKECVSLLTKAFHPSLIVNSFLCLKLKEFTSYVEGLELLPDALSVLPIPTYMIFVLIFFIGGLFNSTGIIAVGAPLAFSTLSGGAPLMMLLMCMCHMANQLSPTHICVVIAADHFGISLGSLIRRIAPPALIFCVLAILYYNLLILI